MKMSGNKFGIEYEKKVITIDIPKLSSSNKKRIKSAIEEKLMIDPATFGKPLRKSIKGHRSLRVGDYRVIFRIEKDTVKIFLIEHRSNVYKSVLSRIN